MNELKLSIIIPYYNSRKYISRCIESVLQIKEKNIEIIAINDCSTDDCRILIEKYCKLDPRLKLIDLPANRGVSHARNVGLDIAVGKWISFVDSDDEIVPEAYDEMLIREDNHVEMIISKLVDMDFYTKALDEVSVDEVVLNAQEIGYIQNGIIEPDNRLSREYKRNRWIFTSPCAKLYLHSVIKKNELRFDERIRFAEDALFNYQYLSGITSCVCLGKIGYLAYQNNDSAMHKFVQGKGKEFADVVGIFFDSISGNRQELYLFGIRMYLNGLRIDFCTSNNQSRYKTRKREALIIRKNELINECFEKADYSRIRKAALPISIAAKYKLFGLCDFMLKMKEKLQIRL